MRVLFVCHRHPKVSFGGAEIASYKLYKLCRAQGIDAVYLGASSVQKYFPKGTGLRKLSKTDFMIKVTPDDRLSFRRPENMYDGHVDQSLFNDRFFHFLQKIKPDVIHFHHCLGLGLGAILAAQAYRAIAQHRVAICYTLHEFLMICVRDGQMLRAPDSTPCSGGTPKTCATCVSDYQEPQIRFRNLRIKTASSYVDRFISPSRFLKDIHIKNGFSEDIEVIHNIYSAEQMPSSATKTPECSSFAIFGQISDQKGIWVLIDAVRALIAAKITHFKIHIFGTISDTIRKRIEGEFGSNDQMLVIHGRYKPEDVMELMQSVATIIVPSIWWENAPVTIQEAFAAGRPILTSNIGGMAEMVEDNVSGLHFRTGDGADLAMKMQEISDERTWQKLANGITNPVNQEQVMEQHFQLYRELLDGQTKRP